MSFSELNLIILLVLIIHLCPPYVEANPRIPDGKFSNPATATIEVDEDYCPFSYYSYNHSDLIDLSEVGFKAQIQAEISYWHWGENIDESVKDMDKYADGDLIIDFEEKIGVQVKITPHMEKAADQIYHKKIIDIEIIMTDIAFDSFHNHHKSKSPFFIKREDFSITISPTYYNKFCEEEGYPKKTTIKLTFGCDPQSSLKLKIEDMKEQNGADIEIEREPIVPFHNADQRKDITIKGNYIFYPRDKINGKQRKLFSCSEPNKAYCTVPYSSAIKKENIYSVKTKYEIFPIFEQVFSNSSREVYGNVILYDILGLGDEIGTTFETNTSLKDAGCLTNGDNWYEKSIKHHAESIRIDTDIYDYYIDCFKSNQNQPQDQDQDMLEEQSYFIFNQTNKNSIKFPNDKNKIIILKAILVNTNYSRFTFCHRLEGYFIFRVIGQSKLSRLRVGWIVYLIIFLCVIGILILSYTVFYFAYDYKSIEKDERVERRKIKEMERDLVEARFYDIKESKNKKF